MDDNKKKALAAALGQIEKQFGKGSVMRLGDNGPLRDIETISTGCLGLDFLYCHRRHHFAVWCLLRRHQFNPFHPGQYHLNLGADRGRNFFIPIS